MSLDSTDFLQWKNTYILQVTTRGSAACVALIQVTDHVNKLSIYTG